MGASIERMFESCNAPGHIQVTERADGCQGADLWHVLATPAYWPRWAPHIQRTTTTAGRPTLQVSRGDVVRIDGVGPTYVTATITHVEEPRRWDFRVDLPLGHHIEAGHEVLRDPVAVRVDMTLHGPIPGPAGGALLTAYRPLAALALRRLVSLTRDGRR